jgi:RNA polymerase sigma-70 factor (ECF subfamily)
MRAAPSPEPTEIARPEAGEGTAALVARSRAGDRGAFGELVARYQASALGLALYHVHQREEAFDVTQDAFVAAYLHLHELDDPRRFGGWLARIVVNRCVSWRRRRRVQVPLDDPAARDVPAPDGDEPETAAERAEARAALRQALFELPPPQRIVLWLHHLEGLRYREIAETLGLPVTTVKGRVQEGHRRLGAALGAVRSRPAAAVTAASVRAAAQSHRLKEAIMAQLEALVVRHSGVGARDGLLLLQAQSQERYVTIALPAEDAVAARPRVAAPGPPGSGLLIETRTAASAPPAGEAPSAPSPAPAPESTATSPLVAVRGADFAFFADLLARLSLEVTSVVLDLPRGESEPGATLHLRRAGGADGAPAGGPVEERAVEVPATYGLALAAATGAPLYGTEALVAAGSIGIGGRAAPDAARAAAQVDQAESTHRLGRALAGAAQRPAGPFRVRLVPRAGLVDVVAADGHVLETLPSTRLGFANLSGAATTPAVGHVAISGVGRFSLAVVPDLTETALELTPAEARVDDPG